MRDNILKIFFLLLLMQPRLGNANTNNVSVPFQNIFLNPNAIIRANYSFGPHKNVFCFANSILSVVGMTWPYKGHRFSAQLPIALKINASIQGSFSDSSGVLIIQNSPNHGLAIVSCLFGF